MENKEEKPLCVKCKLYLASAGEICVVCLTKETIKNPNILKEALLVARKIAEDELKEDLENLLKARMSKCS